VIVVDEVVARLAQRYPQLEQVADGTYRGVDTYEGRPYAIRYFDLNDDLENAAKRLHEYQDGLLGTSYYDRDARADLRWNHYLYFVTSENIGAAFLKAKADVESNREYARKVVVTLEGLTRLLDDRPFGTAAVEGLPPDALSIWTEILENENLGFVADQSLQVPTVVRFIAEGERRSVLRPPGTLELGPAERAAGTDFLARLNIRGFRRYPTRTNFDFGAVNLIVGVNGVGKTSLLEAIEYLFCGKTRRSGSLLPRTAISGVLARSRATLETKATTPQSHLRARHLVWYGKSELRTLTLDDSFGKFNFLDTDAAVRLTVDQSRERLVDDLAQLLLGAEAAKVFDRFDRVIRQLGEEKKTVAVGMSMRDERRSNAAERLRILREAPRDSEALFADLVAALRRIGWSKLPTDRQQGAQVSELIQAALGSISVLKSSAAASRAEDLDIAIEALGAAEMSIKQWLDEDALRTRESAAGRRRLQKLSARVEALDALVPLIASRVSEIAKTRATLEMQLSQQMGSLAEAEEAVARLPSDVDQEQALSDLIATWIDQVRIVSARIDSSKKALSAFERAQSTLSTLHQSLRSSAQEIMHHTGDATHCPLCRAEYAQSELRARIEQLVQGVLTKESDRLRSDVQGALKLHQEIASELAALRTLEGLSAPGSEITLEAMLATVENKREQVSRWSSELETARSSLLALENQGYSVEQLTKLASAAGISTSEIAQQQIESLLPSLREEKSREAKKLFSLETAAQDAKIRLNAIATRYGVGEMSAADLARLISERKQLFEGFRRATIALRNYLDVTVAGSSLELEAGLREAQETAVRLRTALAKEGQDSEAIQQEAKRHDDAVAEIEGLQVKFTRLESAMSVLQDLLAQQSERQMTELVQRENGARISSTFAKIHAPNEFDLVMNGGLTIERRGHGKAELDEMSSGQRAAYALSLFFAMNERLTTGPKVLLLDDPVAHVDDINTLSLLDHLRDIALSNQRQIFFATADSKIAALFARKFRFLGDQFRHIELNRD
jgi:DNA repair exonuclease SbcCD ATPase subunit